MDKTGKQFEKLLELMARLRSETGCPWDQKQNLQTLKPYILEETYELLEALDQEDPAAVREELGDLLFMLVFVARIFTEKDRFTMADAIEGINEKMTRRHPHVFGDTVYGSEQEFKKHWQTLKTAEKNAKGDNSDNGNIFSSIPKTLPALALAQQVSRRAARSGFEWQNIGQVIGKIQEETAELQEAIDQHDPGQQQEEIGDLLFAIVNASRLLSLNSEEALRLSTVKFISRFRKMEELLMDQGGRIDGLPPETLLDCWQKTKKQKN